MLQAKMGKMAMLAVIGLLVLVAVTGCGASGAGVALPLQQSSGYPPANTITVSGFGDANGVPDIAYVNLGINIANADVGQAVNDANAAIQAVEDAVKALGVAEQDIQTSAFNVWPEERYDPSTGMSTGQRTFHVDSMLMVTVRDLSQTSAVIEAALNAGANSVQGLSFGIEDTSALESQARTAAVENARVRAQELAQATGVSLGDPIIVTEVSGYGPVYPMLGGGRGGADTASAPPINPGQLSVTVNVQVTFSTQ